MSTTIHAVRHALIARIAATVEQQPSHGAEVGVHCGDFSAALLEGTKVGRLYSVDAWRHFPDVTDALNLSDFEHSVSMRETAERLAPFGRRSVIIRDLSTCAANIFRDGLLDFVYLDAGHTYEAVLADLNAWVPRVRAGGLICGDDFVDGNYSHRGQITTFGVRRAVETYFKARGWQVESDPPSVRRDYLPQWWVKVPRL